MSLTLERAHEVIEFDAHTGALTWKYSIGSRALKDTAVKTLDKKGYVYFGIDGKYYFGHRVAWFLHFGVWPKGQIDHINGVKADNRIVNLRDSTQTENMQNGREPRKHNKTGLLGVSENKGKFQAEILVAGKRMFLGTFTSPFAARDAYLEAKRKHHSTCSI